MVGEGIKIVLGIDKKEKKKKMYSDLTHEEIGDVKRLLGMGYTPDFVTHTIVMRRGVSLSNAIRAQVDVIIEEAYEL